MPRHIMGIPAASVADEQSAMGFAWGFIAAMALMAWMDTRRIVANLRQSDDKKDD